MTFVARSVRYVLRKRVRTIVLLIIPVSYTHLNEWRDAHTRLDAWRKLAASRSIDSQIVRCHTWDASEAYAHMNHLIDEYGRRGAALPTEVLSLIHI